MEENNFQKYFSDGIIGIQNLGHKGNNQLFKVSTTYQEYLLKRYSTHQKDNWDRGKTEFRAISNFWEKGLRVPKPIAFYEEDHVGIYSFEQGRVLKPEEVREKDIKQAAIFLGKLHTLGTNDKKTFPLERTACLNIYDYISLLDSRLATIRGDFAGDNEARSFLDNQICPEIDTLKDQLSKQTQISLDRKLSLEAQVITPGDFGFHNILVSPQTYTFVDFEFCGRDDPVKQILDFLHHDKTKSFDKALKQRFLEQYRKEIPSSEDFERRLKLVDPLIGMNWVLIYLNPLSRKYQEHMRFAQGPDTNISEIIKERLAKAKKKLEKLSFFDEEEN